MSNAYTVLIDSFILPADTFEEACAEMHRVSAQFGDSVPAATIVDEDGETVRHFMGYSRSAAGESRGEEFAL